MMTSDEHRARAEWSLAEADRAFAQHELEVGPEARDRLHRRAGHLRQSAIGHAILAMFDTALDDDDLGPEPEVTEELAALDGDGEATLWG